MTKGMLSTIAEATAEPASTIINVGATAAPVVGDADATAPTRTHAPTMTNRPMKERQGDADLLEQFADAQRGEQDARSPRNHCRGQAGLALVRNPMIATRTTTEAVSIRRSVIAESSSMAARASALLGLAAQVGAEHPQGQCEERHQDDQPRNRGHVDQEVAECEVTRLAMMMFGGSPTSIRCSPDVGRERLGQKEQAPARLAARVSGAISRTVVTLSSSAEAPAAQHEQDGVQGLTARRVSRSGWPGIRTRRSAAGSRRRASFRAAGSNGQASSGLRESNASSESTMPNASTSRHHQGGARSVATRTYTPTKMAGPSRPTDSNPSMSRALPPHRPMANGTGQPYAGTRPWLLDEEHLRGLLDQRIQGTHDSASAVQMSSPLSEARPTRAVSRPPHRRARLLAITARVRCPGVSRELEGSTMVPSCLVRGPVPREQASSPRSRTTSAQARATRPATAR